MFMRDNLFETDFDDFIVKMCSGKQHKNVATRPRVPGKQESGYIIKKGVEEIDKIRHEIASFVSAIDGTVLGKSIVEYLKSADKGFVNLRKIFEWDFDPDKIIKNNGEEKYKKILQLRNRWYKELEEKYGYKEKDSK